VFEEYNAPRSNSVYSDSTTDSLFETFKKPNAVLYVAEFENKIIGCCGVFPTAGLPSGHAELVKLYLDKNFRGMGIGKNLLEICITQSKKFGYHFLYLESFPQFSEAIALYKKLGFKNLEHSLGQSKHTACTIWMIKKL
jgi:putative acetyltransferase